MADLPTLLNQLEQLRAAWRSGHVEVAYDGKRVSYRDAEGMKQAIAALEAEIARAQGVRRPTIGVIRSSRGW